MANLLNHLRSSIRTIVRPIARFARSALATSTPLAKLEIVPISVGPAAGCRMLLPVPSSLTDSIASDRYEVQATRFATALISATDVCYDIGGHYGFYTMVMAKIASKGSVHTFEPVPELARRIRLSAEQSQFDHVTVHNAAMAGTVGTFKLRFASTEALDDSMGYLEACGGVDTPRSQQQYRSFSAIDVPTLTLDSLQISPPHFIKMDAEGAEAFILDGATQLLSRVKPRMLIEIHGVDRALQCAAILGPWGYTAWSTPDHALTMPILWIHRDDAEAIQKLRDHFHDTLSILFGDSNRSGLNGK